MKEDTVFLRLLDTLAKEPFPPSRQERRFPVCHLSGSSERCIVYERDSVLVLRGKPPKVLCDSMYVYLGDEVKWLELTPDNSTSAAPHFFPTA